MKAVVVSQPMFFPWVGLFEQIALADTYYHYDDAAYPTGRNFMSRVQLRSKEGQLWLTAPIDKKCSGKLINEIVFLESEDWREKHLKTIHHLYSKCRFFEEMMAVIRPVYEMPTRSLAKFNMEAIETIAKWFGRDCEFKCTSALEMKSISTQRLVDICRHESASSYVTGLGALNYLDHSIFEAENIAVKYMQYKQMKYEQRFAPFIPYVSIIDLMANEGPEGGRVFVSEAVSRSALEQ